jgi:Ni,Fe-hydrogenase maturation factor
MVQKIYCFGNPDRIDDRAALQIADELRIEGIEFVKCTSPDPLLLQNHHEIIIIDVVKGIKKIQVIRDIDRLNDTKTLTMHDFDLSTVLKLLKETGQINNVKIIGIPCNMSVEEAKKKVISFLF